MISTCTKIEGTKEVVASNRVPLAFGKHRPIIHVHSLIFFGWRLARLFLRGPNDTEGTFRDPFYEPRRSH